MRACEPPKCHLRPGTKTLPDCERTLELCLCVCPQQPSPQLCPGTVSPCQSPRELCGLSHQPYCNGICSTSRNRPYLSYFYYLHNWPSRRVGWCSFSHLDLILPRSKGQLVQASEQSLGVPTLQSPRSSAGFGQSQVSYAKSPSSPSLA